MSLKNDTFGFTRAWLVTALNKLPLQPELFAKNRMSTARKAFLAGSSMIKAIKSWLTQAKIIEAGRGTTSLTELGKLMAAKDPPGEQAWTWWLFHLHLCANPESFPYAAFFTCFDAEGTSWVSFHQVVDKLHQCQPDPANPVERSTVESYFEGVERTFRPGSPVYGLGLVERRSVASDTSRKRFRRSVATPPDIVVAYATLLFQSVHFPTAETLETRVLLEKGLARTLGLRDKQFRDALTRIHQHPQLHEFIQFRKTVNLDSVQFTKTGEGALKSLRLQAYDSGEVRWP